MKPDLYTHYKSLTKKFITDLSNRFGQAVDTQALTYPQGVDISAWQGAVDFTRLAAKVQFAYLRAGYGNDYIDPRLNEYRVGCKANGIKYGLYWYVKPGKDAIKHAQSFWMRWQEDPGDLPPCFDLEESGGLGKSALDSWLSKMYNKFVALSGLVMPNVMTYTRASFLDPALGQNGWLKYTQLWVAHWGTTNPKIPLEWAIPLQNNPIFDWDVHQYSATGKGSDYGVSSRYIDLDRGRFDLPQPPTPPGGDELKLQVTADVLNVREGPGTTYADIGDLHAGDVVDLLNVGGTGAWVQIKGGQYDGKWVCVQLLLDRYCEPVE